MNRELVINKFIEKFGSLEPKPDYHFVQGSKNGSIGLTTNSAKVLEVFRQGFFKRQGRYPTVLISSPQEVLPALHVESDGHSYDWSESDLTDALHLLQNSPFKNIKILRSTDPMPIIIMRDKLDISVLLAPDVVPLPKPEEFEAKQKRVSQATVWHGREDFVWVSQLPGSTFWLVQVVATGEKFVKCKSCGAEQLITDWIRRRDTMNHPHCLCSCFTYDDFCGCQKTRNSMTFDRIRRESTMVKHFARGDIS